MTTFDVAIAGAGFSGLVAARNLAAKGFSVLVVEGRDRTGGRARSYLEGGHAPVDLGCSWIHGYEQGTPVRALVEGLGIKANVPKPADSLVLGPNGPLDASLAKKLGANLAAAQGALAAAAQTAESADGSLAASLFEPSSALYAGLSAEERPLADGLARTMQVGFGVPLEKAALRWFGFEDNYAGTDAAPEGGYQAVTDALRAKAEADGAVFKLGETLTAVSQSSSSSAPSSGVTLTTTTASGASQTYAAKTSIVTLPLGVLQQLPPTFFSPALSARKQTAVAQTHVGELAKVVLTYPSAWWPAKTGSFVVLPTAGPAGGEGATAEALLRSVPLVVASFASGALPNTHPTLLTYVASPVSALVEALPTADVAAALHAILAARVPLADGLASAPEPAHAVVTSWSADPFARGATTTPGPVGSSPLNLLELGRSEWHGTLGFAGEHTDVHHRGSVAGACVSGAREADRVAGLLERLGRA